MTSVCIPVLINSTAFQVMPDYRFEAVSRFVFQLVRGEDQRSLRSRTIEVVSGASVSWIELLKDKSDPRWQSDVKRDDGQTSEQER